MEILVKVAKKVTRYKYEENMQHSVIKNVFIEFLIKNSQEKSIMRKHLTKTQKRRGYLHINQIIFHNPICFTQTTKMNFIF